MMRSTQSMSERDCMPTSVSWRMSAGWPINFENSRATLKYSPYSSSSSFGYRCSTSPSPVVSASSSRPATMRPVSYA